MKTVQLKRVCDLVPGDLFTYMQIIRIVWKKDRWSVRYANYSDITGNYYSNSYTFGAKSQERVEYHGNIKVKQVA